MKRIGKIVTAVGVVTALLAGCCLDSQDVYGYLAGALCIIGGFLGGAGYAICMPGGAAAHRGCDRDGQAGYCVDRD